MGARRKLKTAATRIALQAFRWRGDPLASLLSGAAVADPYPVYDRLRREELCKSMLGVYATAEYATAASVLRDGRFSSSPWHQPGYRAPEYPPGDPRSSLLGPETSLLTMEPPDHTRIRRLVASAFTRRATDALEPLIREAAVKLLDGVDTKQGFDVVDALAFPLPITVICHLLGIPGGDEDLFRKWGHDLAMTLEPRLTDEPDAALVGSELALTAYLRELIALRRRAPDESLLSALISVEDEGNQLSEKELVSTALLLLVAGFETTVNLIANGTAALLGAPELWAQLREEPERWPDAVEELLRYDSPVQLTSRIATEDVLVAGKPLHRGESVVVSIAGANRDPGVFSEPGRLLLDRSPQAHHLSFSLGIHHCIGAALARLEARVAFEELAARVERPAPAGVAVRRPLQVLRGYESLPVRSLARGEAVAGAPVLHSVLARRTAP